MIYFFIFLINVCYIGAKSFQQLNVVHNRVWAILPTTMVLALFEISLLGTVSLEFVKNGIEALWLVIPVGLGGAAGCITSMYIHQRMRGAA